MGSDAVVTKQVGDALTAGGTAEPDAFNAVYHDAADFTGNQQWYEYVMWQAGNLADLPPYRTDPVPVQVSYDGLLVVSGSMLLRAARQETVPCDETARP